VFRNRFCFFMLFFMPISYFAFLWFYSAVFGQVSKFTLAVLAIGGGLAFIRFSWYRFEELEVERMYIIKERIKEKYKRKNDKEEGS